MLSSSPSHARSFYHRHARSKFRRISPHPGGTRVFKNVPQFKRKQFLEPWDSDITKYCKWKTNTEFCQARHWMPLISTSRGTFRGKIHYLRVVSYNILAPCNLLNGTYVNTQFSSLEWAHRVKIIEEELRYLNADILCLQEVDSSTQVVQVLENKLGYEVAYQQKTRQRRDGQATAWNPDKFELIDKFSLPFSVSVRSNLFEVPQVCLFTVLRPSKLQSRVLIVGNLHVLHNMKMGHIKIAQILYSLKGFNLLKKKYEAQGYNVTVIFCGDFNLIPNSSCYNLITKGKIEPERCSLEDASGRKYFYYTSVSQLSLDFYLNQAKRFMPSSSSKMQSSLSHSLAQLHNTTLELNEQKKELQIKHLSNLAMLPPQFLISSKRELCRNPLPLKSAYSEFLKLFLQEGRYEQLGQEFYGYDFSDNEEEKRKFCFKSTREQAYSHISTNLSGNTDFIFHDQSIKPRSVYEVINYKKLLKYFEGIPNRLVPSDHFTLASDFAMF